MYLTERRLFFSINHVFSSVTGRRELEDFEWFREYFPAIETHNSHMLEQANTHAADLAKKWRKIGIGGSDAHALTSVGSAYTQVPGSRTKEEFFAGLRNGMGLVAGESGSVAKLTRDVFLIVGEMMCENRWTAALAPLAVLIPAFTLWNYKCENAFQRRWAAQVMGPDQSKARPRWITVPQTAVEEWT
jgi:hypothetical protein